MDESSEIFTSFFYFLLFLYKSIFYSMIQMLEEAMMYLKYIIINRFKNFTDKINTEIERGITGTIGPNCSSKSNIVNAFRWILGD